MARGDGGRQGGLEGAKLGLGGAHQVAGGAQGARLGGRTFKLASKGEEERIRQHFFMSLLSTQVQMIDFHYEAIFMFTLRSGVLAIGLIGSTLAISGLVAYAIVQVGEIEI